MFMRPAPAFGLYLPLVANVPIRCAVNSLVVIPAILEAHSHCVAVQVFVVSDVLAHGDVLFVVWVDGLTVTQIWEGASPEGVKSTMGRNKPIVKNIVACASRLLSQRFERKKARIPTIKRKPLQCVCVKREHVKL